MKLIKTLVLFLWLFVCLCFLDVVFFGEMQQKDNAVFAAIVSGLILITMFVTDAIKKSNL